jgi:TPR repeat protein
MRSLLLVMLLVTGLVASSWADYTAGLIAYEQGDYATALREWTPLAEQGIPEAQFKLGILYDQGLGVAPNVTDALQWYRRAAEQGYAAAQYNLGIHYLLGTGVTQDDAEAARWLSQAAEQGIPLAQFQLGLLFSQGRGVPRNQAIAIRWFREVAMRGDPEAQYQLGLLYSQGQGLPVDYVEAYMWLTLAAAQGYEEASTRRDALATLMTPAERTETEARTRVQQLRQRVLLLPARQASPPLVTEIQRLLRDLGYDLGPIDGVAGQRTTEAIRTYQGRAGLAVDGIASERLLAHLSQQRSNGQGR